MKKVIAILFFLILLVTIPAMAQEESSDEANTVKEKVQQKVAEALNNPKAYLGSITDITDNSVQIKTNGGEIKQIAVDEQKVAVLKINKEREELKFSDVAIGDFIVAMGFADDNGVLDTKRILITSPVENPGRRAIYATIVEISGNEIAAKTKSGDELSIVLNSDGDITLEEKGEVTAISLSDLEEGQNIIVSGEDGEDNFEARRIHVISSSPTPEEPEEPSS